MITRNNDCTFTCIYQWVHLFPANKIFASKMKLNSTLCKHSTLSKTQANPKSNQPGIVVGDYNHPIIQHDFRSEVGWLVGPILPALAGERELSHASIPSNIKSWPLCQADSSQISRTTYRGA